MATDWMWAVAIVLAAYGWTTAMVDRKEQEMAAKHRSGELPRVIKHWFLFDMPWHADGVNTLDAPLGLRIYDAPRERDTDADRLLKLGRLTRLAGSEEAKVYMKRAIRAVAPDVYLHRRVAHYSMDELVRLFKDECYGQSHLF